MTELDAWDSFYLIVGSAAGALVGLQFVVITLLADRPVIRSAAASAAFATPNIVHFCVVLLLSALLRAPWQSIVPVAVLWGVTGLCGLVYTLIVARRMRTQTAYRPDLEDWFFHAVLTFAGYAVLTLSSFAAMSYTREALFAVGAATLLLLFAGIHNAWDAASYHVYSNMQRSAEARRDETSGKDD